MRCAKPYVFVVLISPVLLLPLGLVGCGSSSNPPVGTEVLPLQVLTTSPADGATGIAPDVGQILVTFDAPLDPTTVTTSSIQVTDPTGPVPGSAYLEPGGETLRFVPVGPIGNLLDVDVVLDETLANLTGGTLGSDYLFEFKTQPSGARADPAFFVGQVSDTASITCWLIGDLGPEPPVAETFVSQDQSVATISPTGLVTLVGTGATIIEIDMDGMIVEVKVAAADSYGRGTAVLATGAQWLADTGGDPEYQLHTWDLEDGGYVDDGGYDQYDGIWEIYIENHTDTLSDSVSSLTVDEVSYDGPYAWHDSLRLETEDWWEGHYRSGTAAGQLRPLGESAMHQELTLPATPTTLDFSWYDRIYVGSVFGEEVGARLLVEDLTGGSGTTEVWSNLHTDGIWQWSWAAQSVDLLPWAGETVRLRFEFIGGGFEDWGYGYFIDDASVLEDGTTEHLVNGGFETGTTGWVGATFLIPREVNMEPTDPVAGIEVKRSVYAAHEDGYWIRYLDTFHNPGATAVDITVRFEGDLGSDGDGAVYTAHDGRAVLSYDTCCPGSWSDPSLGTLPGSASVVDTPNFDGEWSFEYDLTIAPGATVSILAFHMFGDDDFVAPNAFLEFLAGDILDSVDVLGVGSPYCAGLTSAEFATVVNWP